MFTGEYRHSVDDKGRLAVPARFRAQLEGGPSSARWLDACLAILTRSGWDDLADKVGDPARSPTRTRGVLSATSSRARSRSSSTARVASCSPGYLRDVRRPRRATRSSSVRAITPRSGLPPAGTTYRRGLEDPTALAAHLGGLGI